MKLYKLPAAAFLMLAAMSPETSRIAAEEWRAEFPHLSIEAVMDRDVPDSRGNIEIGLHFKIEKGWHIYWKNPGDSGLPTRIDWNSPGASFSETRFPPPLRIRYGEMMNYGYEDETLLWTTGQFSGSERAPVTAKIRWALCKDECIPGNATIVMAIGGPESPAGGVRPEIFGKYAALLARPEGSVTAEHDEGALYIRIPAAFAPAGARGAVFVLETPKIIVDAAEQNARRLVDGDLEVTVPLRRGAVSPAQLRGLVLFEGAGAETAIAVQTAAAERGPGLAQAAAALGMLLVACAVLGFWIRARVRRLSSMKEEACLQDG